MGTKLTISETSSGIYYFHDYIPTRRMSRSNVEDVEISKKIWDFKNGNLEAVQFFANELLCVISTLAKDIPGNKIGLVAVPPSKVSKECPMRQAISMLCSWASSGRALREYGCNKIFYDYSTLLMRSSDIPTAHEERRATYDEQLDSISCSRNHLSKYWTTFFILDDVTTKGTSMDVCKDILIANGAKEQYIYSLAMARTIN